MILLRRYETKILKKQPTLEVSEDFPQGKSTSNKLCTVLATVFILSDNRLPRHNQNLVNL
jgi:hypothetical protein